MLARIFADFNSRSVDQKGEKVYIGQEKTWPVEMYRSMNWLEAGARVRLYDGELQVEAILEFDGTGKAWYGRPIWSTRRDLGSMADGLEDYRHADPELKLAIIHAETEFCMKAISGSVELLKHADLKTVQGLPEHFNDKLIDNLAGAIEDLREIVTVLTQPE